jgi:hypothetical protein
MVAVVLWPNVKEHVPSIAAINRKGGTGLRVFKGSLLVCRAGMNRASGVKGRGSLRHDISDVRFEHNQRRLSISKSGFLRATAKLEDSRESRKGTPMNEVPGKGGFSLTRRAVCTARS